MNDKQTSLNAIQAGLLTYRIEKDLYQITDGHDRFTPDVTDAISKYLKNIQDKKALSGFEIGSFRRQLYRDLYPLRSDRKIALKWHRWARIHKVNLRWEDGEAVPADMFMDFYHLLRFTLYGVNDQLTGYVSLRRPSGQILPISLSPVVPIEYIQVTMQVTGVPDVPDGPDVDVNLI